MEEDGREGADDKEEEGGRWKGRGEGEGRGREEAWHPVTDKRREETPWRVRHAS